MWNQKKTQVLVAGAGPVGMTAAICLLNQGIEFEIVDKSPGPCEHSKACLLSPETLEFLERLGLLDAVLQKAIQIKTIQLYYGSDRLGNLSLSDLPSNYPFVASIPQSDLEGILLARLDQYHKKVLWNHRVSALKQEGGVTTVEVDRLIEHMSGYAVMHEEKVVDKTISYEAKVVLAADGLYSLIRRLQKIDYEYVGDRMGTLLFEIKRNPREDTVLKLGFTKEGASAYVPLPHGLGRCGFTTDSPGEISADRDKNHQVYDEDLEQFPELTNENFQKLLNERMTYQADKMNEIVWRASVPFGVQLADSMWTNGIFLLGDAARSGFPLGAKSMNLALPEAGIVVDALENYLSSGVENNLREIARGMRTEWEDLASLEYFASKPKAQVTESSIDPNLILQALPLTGKDLEFAAGKLAKLLRADQSVLT